MMESAHRRDRDDPSRIRWLDGAWLGRILLQAQVGPAAMIVGQELLKVPVQTSLVEHDHVVQALAAKGTDQPFDLGTLPGRPRGRKHLLDSYRLHLIHEVLPEDPITISGGAVSHGKASRN